MDPNKIPDQLPPAPVTAHQGGRVEGAPVSAEVQKNEFATHKNVELPPDVEQAGVVVNTAVNINPRAFTDNPDPKVELLPQDQTPAWLEQQIREDRKKLDNNTKESRSWLGRLKLVFLEKIRANKLDPHPTTG